MTMPPLRVVGDEPASEPERSGQFFLIVADHDQGFFSVEGPMTDLGKAPRAMPATIFTGASNAALPALIETHSPVSFGARRSLWACRREAS
jgi:hypothetical protein